MVNRGSDSYQEVGVSLVSLPETLNKLTERNLISTPVSPPMWSVLWDYIQGWCPNITQLRMVLH